MDITGSKWHIKHYESSFKVIWDEFIAKSRNGTFLFMRDYMDYHSDRFEDHSLLLYYNGKLRAVLPANKKDDVLYSHQGLTYGGFVTDQQMKAAMMMELFAVVKDYLKDHNIGKWVYSPIPYIYSKYPAEEDLYALFRCGAVLKSRKVSTVIPIKEDKIVFAEAKMRNVRRAQRERLVCCCDSDFESFWKILENNLMEKYGAKPVHTLEEMTRLYSSFPENILLYRVCDVEEHTLAGCVVFLTNKVAHVQYISSTAEGREKRAVDFLFHHLVNDVYNEIPYFDFGTSVECGGNFLNEGLIRQKEDFGGRAVVYDTYELDID